MTKKKTQEVKVKKVNTPKKVVTVKVKDNTKTVEEAENKLNGLLGDLKKSLNKAAEEAGIKLSAGEPHSYYVSYSGIDSEDNHVYGCSCFTTDLNIYEKHGIGIKTLAQKFELEKELKSVIILNVIKLED